MTSPFLATTALEDFWDTSQSMVFLGPWCLRHSRRSAWEKLKPELIPSPWQSQEFFEEACSCADDLYEQLLGELGTRLNGIHRVSRGERYWRIILGPWLFHYVHTLYDRYAYIKGALSRYPDLTTMGLAESPFVTPADSLDFVRLAADDAYNLQLFTRILATLGKRFPSRPLNLEAFHGAFTAWKSPSQMGKLRRAGRTVASRLERLVQGGRPIFFKSTYLPLSLDARLALRMGSPVRMDHGLPVTLPAPDVDRQVRQGLSGIQLQQGELGEILSTGLPADIPTIFVEGYAALREAAHRRYPARPKAIATTVCWYWDEAFKEWAASCGEEGTRLVGVQHGGNYGSTAYNVAEAHERAITDVFYSWGWHQSGSRSVIRPMPATKLAASRPLRAGRSHTGILLVASAEPRYLLRFGHRRGADLTEYISWQLRFAEALKPELRRQLRVRLYQRDFGWDFALRWQERFPEVGIEDWSVSFTESMEKCRLYVCDHLSTTFVEALSAGKPTLLFWADGTPELRQSARPYYDQLRSGCILHHLPEDAAETVNRIYEDVATWWGEPERQANVTSFCGQFARTSRDILDEWATELDRLAGGVPG